MPGCRTSASRCQNLASCAFCRWMTPHCVVGGTRRRAPEDDPDTPAAFFHHAHYGHLRPPLPRSGRGCGQQVACHHGWTVDFAPCDRYRSGISGHPGICAAPGAARRGRNPARACEPLRRLGPHSSANETAQVADLGGVVRPGATPGTSSGGETRTTPRTLRFGGGFGDPWWQRPHSQLRHAFTELSCCFFAPFQGGYVKASRIKLVDSMIR